MGKKSVTRRGMVLGGAAAVAGATVAAYSNQPSIAQEAANDTQSTQLPSRMLLSQVAFVTGAARGIGRAIAVALAQSGADIAAIDILEDISGYSVPLLTAEDMITTQQLVEQTGRRYLAIKADVRALNALKAAVGETTQQLGPIDIAIVNAGINSNMGFLFEDDSAWQNSWETITDVNIIGAANTLRSVFPGMAERQSGRVIRLCCKKLPRVE